jgi:hypothetical protein
MSGHMTKRHCGTTLRVLRSGDVAQTLPRRPSLSKYRMAQKCHLRKNKKSTILRVPIFMKLEMLHSIMFLSVPADFTQTRQ